MERDELPEEWEWQRLGEVVEVSYGKGLPEKNRRVGAVRVFGSNGEIGRHDMALTQGATIIIGRKGSVGAIHLSDSACWPIDTTYFIDHFPSNLDAKYLSCFLSNQQLAHFDRSTAVPGLNRNDLYSIEIPLPPLPEQRRIVARIEGFARRVEEIRKLRDSFEKEARQILLGAYARITEDAACSPMGEVAPLVRRAVKVDPIEEYHELGIRSFGKGTFHKPAVHGSSLIKRIYQIEPGDLLFNNVFAWEGAVAVARSEDRGRVGSHRFITCVPKDGVAKSTFLCFHFLTERGLQQLGEASPGSAGRNRTLGLKALAKIEAPVPPFEKQVWFDALYMKMDEIRRSQIAMENELEALMPSVLAKAFRGEL